MVIIWKSFFDYIYFQNIGLGDNIKIKIVILRARGYINKMIKYNALHSNDFLLFILTLK